MKETTILELGASLETTFTEVKNKLYHFNQPKEYTFKIESIQNMLIDQPIELPYDGKLIIKRM